MSWTEMAKAVGRFCVTAGQWILSAFWVLLLITLFATWINTIQHLQEQHRQHIDLTFEILCTVILLSAFFLLAGFEIAYTDLRDKDPTQVGQIGELLREMQRDEGLIYESREWLGVILIVVFAYFAEFDSIYPPWLHERNWRFAFSLLFTTFPIVWLAQAPAKYFARLNSETFLRRTAFVWPAFKAFGWLIQVLQLRFVSDLALSIFSKSSNRRNLPPSTAAFYVSSLKRYGYALHECTDEIMISADGTATMTQTGLVYIVSPDRTRLTRRCTFGSPVTAQATIAVVSVRDLKQPGERLEEIREEIEKCKAAPPRMPPLVEFRGEPVQTPDPNKAEFALIGRWRNQTNSALLLEYRLSAASEPNAFVTQPNTIEFHELTCTFPHDRYTAILTIEPNAPLSFASPRCMVRFQENEHQAEAGRVNIQLDAGGKRLTAEIEQPLPGAVYRLEWENW